MAHRVVTRDGVIHTYDPVFVRVGGICPAPSTYIDNASIHDISFLGLISRRPTPGRGRAPVSSSSSLALRSQGSPIDHGANRCFVCAGRGQRSHARARRRPGDQSPHQAHRAARSALGSATHLPTGSRERQGSHGARAVVSGVPAWRSCPVARPSGPRAHRERTRPWSFPCL